MRRLQVYRTALLITLSTCIHLGQIAVAEDSAKTNSIYNQISRNVIPIAALQSICTLADIIHDGPNKAVQATS